ncbi:MAG: germination protein YpeB [Eubacteriales bacterium]|nr:germination protein YpeB [Eubacteriales bacterium]
MSPRVKKSFYLCTVIVLLLIVSVTYQYLTIRKYENRIAADYRGSLSDIAEYAGDIDYDLTKLMLVSSPSTFTGMAENIWRISCLAGEEIGRLPAMEKGLDNAERYFAQTGEFALALARKTAKGQMISDEERSQLRKLGEYASKLNSDFQETETKIYTAQFTKQQLLNQGNSYLAATSSALTDNMATTEESMADYPSLIYDGPFSEHLVNSKPKLLEGVQEVSSEEAKMRAIAFFGDEDPTNVKAQGELGDGIKTYSYSIKRDKNQRIAVEITKKGGYLFSVINDRIPQERICSVEEAVQSGRSFLKSENIGEVKESYYQYEGNNLIINYAPVQNGWVLYPDLIKVIVAMDNCEITGYESTGYIMNHKRRQEPQKVISPQEAKGKIKPEMEVASVGKALIPLDDGREEFCYEIKGKFMDKQVIVYVNAVTGDEEDILILLDTPGGTLAV